MLYTISDVHYALTEAYCLLYRGGSLPLARCSVVSSASKPSSGTLVSLAGLLGAKEGVQGCGELQHRGPRGRTVSGDSSGTPSLARGRARAPTVMARIVDPLQVQWSHLTLFDCSTL